MFSIFELNAGIYRLRTFAFLSLLAVVFFGAKSAVAADEIVSGSCDSFDLAIHIDPVTIDETGGWSALTLYDGVQVRATADINAKVIDTLKLATSVQIVKEQDSYLGFRPQGESSDGELSWVKRNDLLCENRPLFDKNTRLERKAVIRIDTYRSDDVSEAGRTVSAAKTPFDDSCADTCRKLSRFELYFIVAETENSVLLARNVRFINDITPFVGWIKKQDIYEWPYAVGARVDQDFVVENESGTGYGAICGYLSKEEAELAEADKCQPILGGPSWFKTATRLLIMKEHKSNDGGKIYETVAPISSVSNQAVRSNDDGSISVSENGGVNKTALDPTALRGVDADVLLRNNRIDLFFLIDGTQSMKPYIDALRGVDGEPGIIQTMVSGFAKDIEKGIVFRAGFRVYRDTNNPDRQSIGEGLPFPEQQCSKMTAEDGLDNLEAFQKSIGNIQVSENDKNDDYAEDLLGGLAQTMRDIRSCPKNRKLVFVISDAGYDAAQQQKRGVPVSSLEKLTTRFNKAHRTGGVYFLRTAFNKTLKDNKHYVDAYNGFNLTASQFLKKLDVVKEDQNSESKEKKKWLFSLGDKVENEEYAGASIVGKIKNDIAPELQTEAVSELMIDIRGGASLEKAIARLKKERVDIPAYFWRVIKRGACKDLGESCKNSTFQSVTKVFLKAENKNLKLDVWMTEEQIQDWQRLLKAMLAGDRTGSDDRKAIMTTIYQALRTIIREPKYEEETETIGEYLRRAGKLPTGFKTPLLGYSIRDILNPQRTQICELKRLKQWLQVSYRNFGHLQRNDMPVFETAKSDPSCVTSDAGKRLPIIISEITSERLPDQGRFSQEANKGSPIFWLPQEFLP